MTEPPSGLLVLDKPPRQTSYDCVHRVKRISGISRVGHCGTLDPLAEGVLLVLVGPATKRQDEMLTLDKQYWFRAELGKQTTTGDREGAIEQEAGFKDVTRSAVEEAIRGFQGDHTQVPPRYSALKYKGKPYYEYARQGVEIPRASRTIHVYRFELLSFEPPFWEGRVVCSRGTYIRTIVEDVAKKVGTVGVLDSLIRERVGTYHRRDGLTWDQLNALDAPSLLSRLQEPVVSAHA